MKLDHKVFGKLILDDLKFWVGAIELKVFDEVKIIELVIDVCEDLKILKEQEVAYLNFFKDKERILNEVEKKIYKYYLRIKEEVGDSDRSPNIYPNLDEARELKKYITLRNVVVPDIFNEGENTIGLIFDCKRDVDNGVGVKIINNEISEIGIQDIVL